MTTPTEIEDTITITRERYEELLKAETFLECLEGIGVDNWQGYDLALEEFQKVVDHN